MAVAYLALNLAGLSLREARMDGWMFKPPAGGGLGETWDLTDLRMFPWEVLTSHVGDLLAVMEALYREVTARRALERSFEDMVREINHLIEQMSDDERRTYLAESLFLNTVKYENDKLEAYIRRLEHR